MGVRKSTGVFAVLVVAGLATASSATAATSLSVSATPSTAGTSGSPQPLTVALNTTVDNDGAGAPVARTASFVQTFPAEFASQLGSFGTCAESSFDAPDTPPGGTEDPTVSCPANSIVGSGALTIVAVGLGPAPIPASSDKVVLVKNASGGLSFWVTYMALGSRISKILPGSISTNGLGQTVLTYDPTGVEPSPALRVLTFNTTYANAFASTGCAAGTWAFSLADAFVGGTPATQTADASAPCSTSSGGDVAPANTALPTISGTAEVGSTLTAGDGTWTGTPAPTFARQWKSCDAAGANCSDISGATTATYVLQVGDVGKTIRVDVTATNSSGSASATSAQTAAVTNAPAPGSPTVEGDVPQTESLSVTPTAISLGNLLPGVTPFAIYTASTVATVTSSSTASALTISDADAAHPGHLVQGAYFLPEALKANAAGPATPPAGATYSGSLSAISGSGSPLSLATYGAPVANDQVTVGFSQKINATDALHTGKYAKTFTMTLAQTTP